MIISPETSTLINQAIAGLFTVVILPTIPLVYRFVKSFAESKIAQIEDDRLKTAVEFAFKRLDFVVSNTVAAISQVSEKSTGLTDEEKKSRLNKARAIINRHISDSDMIVLKGAVKDFDKYLSVKIEASRYFQKNREKDQVVSK